MSFTLPEEDDCQSARTAYLAQLASYAQLLEVITGAAFIRSPGNECTFRSSRRIAPGPIASIAARSRNAHDRGTEPPGRRRDWRAGAIAIRSPAPAPADAVHRRSRVFSDPAG
jgi:hypothetical protein